MTGIARSVSPGKHSRFGLYAPASPIVSSSKPIDPVVASPQGALTNVQVIQQLLFRSCYCWFFPVTWLMILYVFLFCFSFFSFQDRPLAPSATTRSATIANSPHPKLAASPIAKNLSGESGGLSTVVRKSIPLGRGVPPPVPPNKPIVPPKKDGILTRKLDPCVSENADKNMQKCSTVAVKDRPPNTAEKHDDPVCFPVKSFHRWFYRSFGCIFFWGSDQLLFTGCSAESASSFDCQHHSVNHNMKSMFVLFSRMKELPKLRHFYQNG